jgi:AraC-like DNA-binding protein
LNNSANLMKTKGMYVEWPVRAQLAEVLVCAWRDQSGGTPRGVLPDACIDIVWDGANLRVAGPDTRPVTLVSDATFVGIRFRPGTAPSYLGADAVDLCDRGVALAELWGSAADGLAAQLSEHPEAVADLLQAAVLQRRKAAADPLAARVLDALRCASVDRTRLDWLARRVETSERSLRRHCLTAFGYGPKTLERILRFRHAVRLAQGGLPLASVAQASGYADQAHLSREFQRLAASSPRRIAMRGELRLTANGVD